MTVTQTVVSDEQELQTQALTVVRRSQAIQITNQESYDIATHLLLNEIKPMRARWQAYWAPIKESAYRSYKGILDKLNEGDKPLGDAEGKIKSAIAKWNTEQERIRQAQQRAAQEGAERLEREQREAEALQAIDAGLPEDQVEAILSAAPVAVAPVLAPTYQKAAGVSTRDNWVCRVTDLKKLCAAVAKGTVSESYVLPNESALNARARAEKGTLNIPGVQAYNSPIVSGRSSR